MTINSLESSTLSGDVAKQKEMFLLKHLDVGKDDWYLISETPTEWATDKIIEFQKTFGYSQCEVMGINDLVFCFGPIEGPMFDQTNPNPDTYKYNVTQRMACFRRDSNERI